MLAHTRALSAESMSTKQAANSKTADGHASCCTIHPRGGKWQNKNTPIRFLTRAHHEAHREAGARAGSPTKVLPQTRVLQLKKGGRGRILEVRTNVPLNVQGPRREGEQRRGSITHKLPRNLPLPNRNRRSNKNQDNYRSLKAMMACKMTHLLESSTTQPRRR